VVAHHNFDNNVLMKWTGDCFVKEILTYAQSYGWTPSAYQLMLAYIGDTCYADSLIPYPVTAGTGIGPNGEWYTPDGTNIYLVEDE
jgi:hypothetical protein